MSLRFPPPNGAGALGRPPGMFPAGHAVHLIVAVVPFPPQVTRM